MGVIKDFKKLLSLWSFCSLNGLQQKIIIFYEVSRQAFQQFVFSWLNAAQ